MRWIILFDGKTYITESVPEGVSVDDIWDRHPGFSFLDSANSVEQAATKIQQDRDRHRVYTY